MADFTGTEGDDVLNGTNKADLIDGGEGDDIINSGAGNDIVYGGEGDDQIHAGAGDDELFGGEGNDQLVAGAGDDILEGGVGDDVLNGGGGSDTFVFNFTVAAGGTSTITYGAVPLDYDAPTGNPNNPTPPDEEVSESEFAQFSQDYQAWLNENAPADYTYAAPQPNPVNSISDPDAVDGDVQSVELTNGQIRYWEDTIEVAGGEPEITASDGNDTITQFQNAGPNVDQIVLKGLAGLDDTTLDALFDLTASDVNNDGVLDSVLSWQGGSITLLGTSTWGNDLLGFMHDDQVVLA
jgi:Ca2+-binding RTX toxin-like protein